MDFKWEMQERIDAGMSPDMAYEETRDFYAGAYDNRDKFELPNCKCDDLPICNCSCDSDCECNHPVTEGPSIRKI